MRTFLIAATMCLVATSSTFAAVPASITVQGRLTDVGGAPLPAGFKVLTFRIFDASTSGTQIWPAVGGEAQTIASSAEGLWVALVGALSPLDESVFADTVRWLEVNVNDGVNPPTTMPRVRLVTSAYAFRTGSIDGAMGGVITSKVSIGPGTTNAGTNAFSAGEDNTASGNWSAISGGVDNIADDTGSVVGGGGNNRAKGKFSTVGGGGGTNPIDSNSASASLSTVSGGSRNYASQPGATVGGGSNNHAADNSATVSGGFDNTASGNFAAIAGGSLNVADGTNSTAGGGRKNFALGDHSTIAGGGGSTAADSNLATGAGSTIGGGSRHVASGRNSAIGGGLHNHAGGDFAAICGGGGSFPSDSNVANGRCASIPGGTRNWANGNYSLAAGRRSQALHGGTFVWGDSTDADFASTVANTFLIRASNGVGIGTNEPEAPVHILETSAGTVTANANSILVLERSAGGWISMVSADASQRGILFSEPATGIAGGIVFDAGGTNDLAFRTGGNITRMTLDASGNLNVTGNITATGTCCASDLRYKKNITTITNAVQRIEDLRGVEYDWRCDEFADRNFSKARQTGVIAQEVREVVPNAVVAQDDGYLAVDYSRLIPLLIEGMKEQQRTIDMQNERIANLEKKLEQ